MDIQLTDEQSLLKDSIQRLLRERYEFSARRRVVSSEAGRSPEHWRAFADLGLLAAPFSEASGGLGGGPLTTMIVMHEFGRHLVVEPYFETIVVAGGLLEAAGSPAQHEQYLPAIMSGDSVWTLAWAEAGSRYDFERIQTRAERQGNDYVLSGGKAVVVAAPWADKLIVSARVSAAAAGSSPGSTPSAATTTAGDRNAAAPLTLFIVDRDAPGVTIQSFKTIDGRRAAEITFDAVRVPAGQRLGDEGGGVGLLDACRDRAMAASCAEAVGAMSALNAATLDYTKTRKQFGVPLGSFQVLQHRMVDMFIAHEEALSLMQHLTLAVDSGAEGVSKLASGAKAKIGEAARFVGEQAVQLHGGMGMSDELNVGHYLKRLAAINIQFGDSAHHLARFASIA